MKKNVLIFGSILGTIMVGHMVYMVNLLYHNPDIDTNDVLGYAAMVIVFSLTFFGIRNYRNNQLNGIISLGKGFKTGALIALLGSSMYVVVWLFYYYLFVPDFIDKYIEHAMIDATRHGATQAELAATRDEMEQFKSMYQSPFFVIVISYAEVLPVGLAVAFISALILKRKTKSTTTNEN